MRAKKTLSLPLPEALKSNKLEDIKEHFRLLTEELDKAYRLLWQDTANIQVAEDGWIYFGDKDTDGSWRVGRVGNNWEMQRRESGTFVKKAGATPQPLKRSEGVS